MISLPGQTDAMPSGYLTFHDVDSLARQALDLLDPEAALAIEQTPRNNAYVFPQATGGDQGWWRITATIAPGNSAVFSVDPGLAAAPALAEMITHLAAACQHEFRGRAFPECSGHTHAAQVEVDGDVVVLACPSGRGEGTTLIPQTART